MGSHITGIIVAILVVLGMKFTVENFVGVPLSAEIQELEAVEPKVLRRLATDDTATNRVAAIIQLGENPGELEETVPLLARLTVHHGNELLRIAAETSLKKIGKDAGPHLESLVNSDDFEKIKWACSAMKSIGQEGSQQYLPRLQDFMLNEGSEYKKIAVYAIQGMGRDAALESMDGLITCLRDKDFNTQCMSCRVLEKLGPDALDAEEALLELLDKGNVSARGWAAICLGALGPTSSEVNVVELLHERLKKAHLAVDIQRLLIGLAHLGPEASEAKETIQKVLDNHKDKIVQGHAAFALWAVSGDSEETQRSLRSLLDSDQIAPIAADLIGRMGKAGSGMVPDLISLLESEDEGTRESAVISLGNIGIASEAAIPKLKKIAGNDRDPLIRSAAKDSIKLIQEDLEKAQKAKDERNKRRNPGSN